MYLEILVGNKAIGMIVHYLFLLGWYLKSSLTKEDCNPPHTIEWSSLWSNLALASIFPFKFWAFATETSLTARIDTAVPCNVLFLSDLCFRSLLVNYAYVNLLMKFTPKIKHFSLFSVTISDLVYLLIRTLHISHRDNRLGWYFVLARAHNGKLDFKWSAESTNISYISWQNFQKRRKKQSASLINSWSSIGFALKKLQVANIC